MCGICGVVDLTENKQVNPALVRGMADRIRHRGPDGDGFYDAPGMCMGMRRLSIIDVVGSDQPLYNEDESIAMVFNGEIYNYRELQDDLRAKGHTLRTEGDGETIIHLYENHGVDLFRHLRGMYAFALWDTANERLLLAVDHIGMKPIYLHERGGKLHFASEIKAFYADPAMPFDLNLDVLDTYLSFGYPLGQETLFEDVRRLPPGYALVIEKGNVTLHPYWAFGAGFTPDDTSHHAPYQQPASDIITQAREHLLDSVTLHLRSDVPLGLFLSGGIDSAAVLALMAQSAGGRIKTYTVGFTSTDTGPDNELLHARHIAEHFATEHHERVLTPADWWDGLERYAYYHDEPNANPSAISMLLLAEETARHVKVVLTGLGGDELFGGYPFHHTIPALLNGQHGWRSLLKPLAGPMGWLEQFYPAFKRYRGLGALPTYLPRLRHALLPPEEGLLRMQSFDGMVFSDALRDRLYGDDLKTAWTHAQHKEQTYAAILAKSYRDDPANTAQALVINTWLTGNALLSQDKVTMAHSLEARVPFFDPALFDFAAKIPPSIRMKANKYVLRQAMQPYLPGFALQRPKHPFSTPIRGWFAHALRETIREVLLDSGALSRQLFNADALESLLRGHFSGKEKHEEVVFRLLNLELWHRAFQQTAVHA